MTIPRAILVQKTIYLIFPILLFVSKLWAENGSPVGKFSPMERMQSVHLKSAHDDVLRLQKTRKTLDPLTNLNDYKAILHAHAEDSAHTGGNRTEMLADAKKAGVNVILLTDHFRPPRDFIQRQLARVS